MDPYYDGWMKPNLVKRIKGLSNINGVFLCIGFIPLRLDAMIRENKGT